MWFVTQQYFLSEVLLDVAQNGSYTVSLETRSLYVSRFGSRTGRNEYPYHYPVSKRGCDEAWSCKVVAKNLQMGQELVSVVPNELRLLPGEEGTQEVMGKKEQVMDEVLDNQVSFR
ncbi:hypothetical protein NDU88_001853 [Pleurodeles waltl]|uniref:Uncharacterized protein n=1 Tax=Pleurodeles waltl TaxID=8319 RepID=A0AAV7LYV2_PLEWA|nr:hypothetical protein NDU88_001853 [Pleurodeles waltl]